MCQGSQSAKTGLPPASITAKAQEIIVNEGIITSSPDFKLSDLRATISAAVPLVQKLHIFYYNTLPTFFQMFLSMSQTMRSIQFVYNLRHTLLFYLTTLVQKH